MVHMGKIVVVGAGIGGLSVALRLKHAGHDVVVFEKNSSAGGKMGEILHDGFRFDTGPSLFTLPWFVDELFDLFGRDARKYFDYKKLNITCRYFYTDGIVIDAYADKYLFARELQQKVNEPPQNILNYLEKYKALYTAASPVFLFNAFQRWRNFARKEYRSSLFYLHKLDTLKTMHNRNLKSFVSPHVVQIFDRYATYNGSDPFRAPATLNMISHLENNLGAYFPEKGMRSIVTALEKLAIEVGVTIKYNTPVEELVPSQKKIKGAVVNGSFVEADSVVCDADVRSIYLKALTGTRPPRSVLNKELSTSAVIFYWGLNRTTSLELHNILFANDYKAEFEALFGSRKLYHDPTVYIFISSKVVQSDAPNGCENWFVMINTSPDYGQDWEQYVKDARGLILEKIKRVTGIDAANHIISEHVATPITIQEQTSSFKGALYGNSSNNMFSAFNRHANFSTAFKNLWFVGGSVHPGGGIPLCLSSAKIVCDEMKQA